MYLNSPPSATIARIADSMISGCRLGERHRRRQKTSYLRGQSSAKTSVESKNKPGPAQVGAISKAQK